MDENNKENNLTGDDINLDQEDNIIDDAECPKCHKVVADKAEFCSCGFYYKSYKRARMYLFFVILIALIAFIGFLLSCFGVFAKIEQGAATKISQEDMFSSTSPVMQVEKIRIH